MSNLKKIIAIVFFLLTVFACRKDFERPSWDVDLLAPLIRTTLTLNDLLPDSVIQVNPDTSIKLVYQTNIFNIEMDSLFKIPDTTITEVYVFPFNSVANPGNSFYSTNKQVTLNVSNGVELNYALVESGFIELEIFSQIKEKVIITYTVPSATKNGDTLVIKDIVDAGTFTQDGYLKKTINLSGYELDLTGISKSEVNTFITRAVATVDTNALTPVTISMGEKITYKNTLIDIVPYFVRGYFGTQQIHFGPETTNVSVFNLFTAGTLDLEQVDVTLDFKNGIGVDAQLILNQFATINTTTANTATLSHSSIGTPLNLNRAQLTYSIPEVNFTHYNIAMNTSNSNIDQLIELFPNQLLYDINLNVNPLGNISGGNDFVYKKHTLETNLNIEFPLSLVANNLTLQDTVNFNLSSESETGKIIDGTLFIYANNGYPFNAVIKMDLYDGNFNFLQNLSVNNYIQSAPVDAFLKVIGKKESVVAIPLTPTAIDNLYKTKKIVLSIAFTTASQPQFIKIYEGYSIDIKVVGDFSYNTSFN
ncbi:MAG: hypothetical protein A3K10_09270 [Bacteroidetes bacterium RIFCSPLOWO2_12_FULL_31_6]|nr:MAG: hypothetical protein A3K10_09270 [Bacteroidetes bacterium RIFCSPLOWO2_12_FULL_31_6]